jgi:hypothetical protein
MKRAASQNLRRGERVKSEHNGGIAMPMNESEALVIQYDFKAKTGVVAFPEGYEAENDDIIDYFLDATEGRVQQIKIRIGDHVFVTLTRTADGKWLENAG